ncbi:hypothetical protein [uncultured Georgenia sp.]|uniref:hypothetical protein n=1 Tax=uncultured Georgenia sp. TaxID=378209 RepID=UPI0026158F26|nr:hypothetical protein [uncultured Georgenia sp.]HLV04154.1 hypothetical protein [Actinomycetaceae bacterium]
MGQLVVDTELLVEAGGQLGAIVDTFMYADHDAEALAEHVGHPGLARKVTDFALTWQSRRQEMLETIGSLADVAAGVGLAFEELDQLLADKLTLDPEVQATISGGAVPQ